MSHIGTLREKPLHAALKRWFAEPGDATEVPVDGYVIDLVRGDTLIEIQTRGFSSMKKKVRALLDGGHSVRIVYPIAVDSHIVKLGPDNQPASRRLSPKHGAAVDVVTELVAFPDLLDHPALEIQVVLIRQDEVRSHAPDGPWRRQGWRVVERRLTEVIDEVMLASADDLADFLPDGLPDPFTTADIAAGIGRPRRTAQQLAYCLRHLGALDEVGREGNAILYRMDR